MYKEVKRNLLWNSRNVKETDGFLFKKRLKLLHGGYKVLLHVTGRSINQSSKKCFWTENNEIMILTNIPWINSLTWIWVTWKFTYSEKIVITTVTQNNAFPVQIESSFLVNYFNLTIKNNCYWTKMYCVSFFVFSNIA